MITYAILLFQTSNLGVYAKHTDPKFITRQKNRRCNRKSYSSTNPNSVTMSKHAPSTRPPKRKFIEKPITKKELKKQKKKEKRKLLKAQGKAPQPKSQKRNQKTIEDVFEEELKRRERKERKIKALEEFKEKRQHKYGRMREEEDRDLKERPDEYLWKRYCEWAGERLTEIERREEKWDEEQVLYVEDDGNEKRLVKTMKKIRHTVVHRALPKVSKEDRETTPGIETIAVSPNAMWVLKITKDLYLLGGKPVAKLFARHIKIWRQIKFLENHPDTPLGVGTPNRVFMVCERGAMDFGKTKLLFIDFRRDEKFRNVLDMQTTGDDLFHLIHKYARPYLKMKRMKIVVFL